MYRTTNLKNGARVLTINLPGRDSVALGIWAKVGGRYESRKLSGTSHFIEHLVFKGTRNYSMRQIKEIVEGKGGMLNAFTGEESTCYFTKILPKHLDQVFDVLADLTLLPLFKNSDMQRERGVILEEIKMYRDVPSSHVQDLMSELLWQRQPLGRNIAGSMETVSRLSRSELNAFHNKFYNAPNFLITAAGNVSHTQILRLVRKRFKKFFKSESSIFEKADAYQNEPKFNFVKRDIEQCQFVIGLHALSKTDPERYKLGLLHVILGANMSSRLFHEVREKRGLAYSIHSGVAAYLDTGSFTVSAGVNPKKAKLAIEVSLKELKKIAKTGVSAEELRRAKDYYVGQLFLMLEDTLDHMIWVGERYLHLDSFLKREAIKRQIEKVTTEDVRQMAKKIFLTEHLNLALIGPLSDKEEKEIRRNFTF